MSTSEPTDEPTDEPTEKAPERPSEALRGPETASDGPEPAQRSRLPLQGYRKLLIALLGLVALVCLCAIPSAAAHVDKGLEALAWIVGTYMGGSSLSKIGKR